MSEKLVRTLLFAAAIGFFIVWVFEFRRAGILESYWLLLLALVSLLSFQFSRLKSGMKRKREEEKQKSIKKTRKS